MNIGIDIDGVIQDCESYFRAEAEIFDINNGSQSVRNPDAVKVQERMGWPKEVFEKYVNEKMFNIMRTAPLMPCAKEVITWLKEQGHKLFVITARGTFSNVEIGIAKDVLASHGLEFDKCCFNAQDKLIPCTEEKIDYMIDDSFGNVKRLSEGGIKCLYFRAFGSKDIINDNVIDVRNWGEIYKFFYNK